MTLSDTLDFNQLPLLEPPAKKETNQDTRQHQANSDAQIQRIIDAMKAEGYEYED